jgi:hypothetical protein
MHRDWRQLLAEMIGTSAEYRDGLLVADPDTVAAITLSLVDGLLIHGGLDPGYLDKRSLMDRLAALISSWIRQPGV